MLRARLIYGNENGIVLVIALVFLAVLGLLGTTAVIVTTTDIKIGGNYKTSVQAFYDAEAGVQYAIGKIGDGLADGSLSLTGNPVTVNYTAPTGFSFDTITTLTQVGTTSNCSFQATGHSGDANSTIEVVFTRDPLFQYGVFGDEEVDMKNNGAVYSYDSSVTSNPTPTDSTGEGDIGSNGEVKVHNGTYIDGDVGLGDDGAGTEAVYTETGHSPGPTVTGQAADVPRPDPDPLGAIGGDLADDFVTYSTTNDNASAGIADNEISLGNGESLTLTAGNYYLTSIELKNGSSLEIDASGGDVNIYLTGEGGDAKFDAKNGSSFNITGDPTDFTIFSDSTKKIDLKHGTTFKGTIYAPYSKVNVKHSADVYGIIWANEVDIKNSGEVYFDTALKDKWLADTISIVSWKEVRD